jgi:hypothetical protein
MGALMLAHLVYEELVRRGEHRLADRLAAHGVFDLHLHSEEYQLLKAVAEAPEGQEEACDVVHHDGAGHVVLDDVKWHTVSDLPWGVEYSNQSSGAALFELTAHDLAALQYTKFGPFTRQWGGNPVSVTWSAALWPFGLGVGATRATVHIGLCCIV